MIVDFSDSRNISHLPYDRNIGNIDKNIYISHNGIMRIVFRYFLEKWWNTRIQVSRTYGNRIISFFSKEFRIGNRTREPIDIDVAISWSDDNCWHDYHFINFLYFSDLLYLFNLLLDSANINHCYIKPAAHTSAFISCIICRSVICNKILRYTHAHQTFASFPDGAC